MSNGKPFKAASSLDKATEFVLLNKIKACQGKLTRHEMADKFGLGYRFICNFAAKHELAFAMRKYGPRAPKREARVGQSAGKVKRADLLWTEKYVRGTGGGFFRKSDFHEK